MNDQPYPFVTELLFRARHHSIEVLSTSPIFRLWHIEMLDPDIVIAQFRNALESESLSAAEKLKLGFLIGYSWPLHYHPKTEELLLLAKTQISESHVAESLLLWGKLASFYLRSNQLARALEELTHALTWATYRTKVDDIVPFMQWATLIFIRLNRPLEIANFANAILAFTHAEENSHYRQSSEFALAISQMSVGNLDRSQSLLEHTCQNVQSGTSRLCSWNQAGAVHWLALLAYKKRNIKAAEKFSALSMELNQSDKHAILNARSEVLLYRLARSKDSTHSASALAEKLAHYQDNTSDDLDIKLNQEITQIRETEQIKETPPPLKSSSLSVNESDIIKLRQSLQECTHSIMHPSDQV